MLTYKLRGKNGIMICVPDSSTLIILSKLEQLELLPGLYGQVIITPQVWIEVIEKGKLIGASDIIYTEACLIRPGYLKAKLTVKEREITGKLKKQGAGPGESEVLALAGQCGALAILDDKAARASAIGLEILHTGTIGVIYEGFLHGLIDYQKLVELLEKYSKVAWISPDLLANIIRRAGGEKV
jgi:uncharacterized protein